MTAFDELGISKELTDAANAIGWSEPTPVQVEAVPVGMTGRDLIAKAQTGTGKTGAYLLIVLSRTKSGGSSPSTLIITPTRELAAQVDGEVRKLSKTTGHIGIPVYGGTDMRRQIDSIRRGADIIVGTPGRLKDMMERGVLDLSAVSEVVLDEADRMLDMGFEEDLEYILGHVPEERQTMMFSATMTKQVKRLEERMLKDPAETDVSSDSPVTGLTKQYIVMCRRDEKKDVLNILLSKGTPKTIVFCATKLMVETLYEEMREKDRTVGTLHGDMPQSLRERVVGSFKDNRTLTLLATDVAARGLDITDVDMVVNFDAPSDPETYLHRIGRTGRAGKEGVAVTIVTKRDLPMVRLYEDETDMRIRRIDPDELEPIDTVHEVVRRERPKRAVPVKKTSVRKTQTKRVQSVDGGFEVIEIGIGKDDGMNRTQIADFVKKRAGLDEGAVGKVGLGVSSSFVEISAERAEEAVAEIDGSVHAGKNITAVIAPKKEKFSDKHGKRKRHVAAEEKGEE